MDWNKWLTGTAPGVLLMAVVGAAAWETLKWLGKIARDGQWRQAEQTRVSELATAERLAGDTQRLLMWIGVFILATLQMLGFSLGALAFGHVFRGDWAIWLPFGVGLLFTSWFALRGIRTLSHALDVLNAKEAATLQAEAQALTERAEVLTAQVNAADPTPSPEDAGQSRGS